MINKEYLNEIVDLYSKIRSDIIDRISDFDVIYEKASNKEIFIELAFCIFTPQSSARQCWKAVTNLLNKKMLFNASAAEISEEINIVRFRNNKARYLVEAREKFWDGELNIREELNKRKSGIEKRKWLQDNVKGMGLKECSHFLRNTGFEKNLAILDRHILKNMVLLGIIDEFPKSLSSKKYELIEKKLNEFADKYNIPMSHLDFVLWYREAGEIFK